MNNLERKPRKIPDPPPQPSWTEKYNCHNFAKGPITVSVSWWEDGYRVRVLGRECQTKFDNLSEGKIVAMMALISFSKKALDQAYLELTKLSEEFPEKFKELAHQKREWERI